MAQVLVPGVAPGIVERLKLRARRNGRSLEAELRNILEAAATEPADTVLQEMEQVRALFVGRFFDDSAALIREDRER